MINNQTETPNNDTQIDLRSSLFKTNFKFIQFKKKSDSQQDETCLKQPENTESIQQFYNELVSQETAKPELCSQVTCKAKKFISHTPLKKSILNKTKKEFLKAAEKNDLELIKSYLEDESRSGNSHKSNFELNSCDDFKWNILMISVVSFSNEIVNYLLVVHSNHEQFSELLYAKDLSGSDAEQLAIKCNNFKALEMIRAAKLKIESANQTKKKN